MTPLVPVGLVVVLSAGTYLSLSIPLSKVKVDSSFYEDSDYFNRFVRNESLFRNSIESDPARVRDYFLNGAFSLYWKDENDQNDSSTANANAFLLNILFPDDIGEDDPFRNSYVPKYYAAGDELTFLLGTSFSFVKKLFNSISD